MSSPDVPFSEMGAFSDMRDRDVEHLLAGQAPAGDEAFDDLATFFRDFRGSFPEVSTEAYEEAHVAAMVEAAQLLADKGEPAARPASKAPGPARQVSGLPKRRRESMRRKWLAPRLAIALVAVLTVFSGMAVAGTLPGPMKTVADALSIDLPDPEGLDDDAQEAGEANDAGEAGEANESEEDQTDPAGPGQGQDDEDEAKPEEEEEAEEEQPQNQSEKDDDDSAGGPAAGATRDEDDAHEDSADDEADDASGQDDSEDREDDTGGGDESGDD